MRIRYILVSVGVVIFATAAAAPFVLAPGPVVEGSRPAPVGPTEQAQTIAAMTPPKRERPVIAIVARNDGTEVSDFLSAYGVLRHANVADVTVVAERADPVLLYPGGLTVEPKSTLRAFEERYPDGADYIVVPAMDPGTDPVIAAWIVSQFSKGAKIVSICNGSRMIATAGLLDGRRATSHWSTVAELSSKHPTMEWVEDRRYVADDRVTTSTGITASVPVMIALVEAIGGIVKAARVAD
jgi:transcriptional regulator GlxA family with amidase domain